MEENSNNNSGFLQENEELGSILRKHLAVTRYAFGQTLLDEGGIDAIFMLCSKVGDIYKMSILDTESITDQLNEADDRCITLQVAEYLAKKLVWGIADYIIVTSEVGLFYGSKEASQRFHREIRRYGENSPRILEQVNRTASVVLYDLSGVRVRGFASSDNCMETFLKWELPTMMEDLNKPDPEILRGEKPRLDDILFTTDWVLDDREAADIKGVGSEDICIGPIRHWDEAVINAVTSISGVGYD